MSSDPILDDKTKQSLFKFFVKVFSLGISVDASEEIVFIEVHVDGEYSERTVDHSTKEKTWDDLLMISMFLIKDLDGFCGRTIDLFLYRRDRNQDEVFVVAHYVIETSNLTTKSALTRQKSSTILLTPIIGEDYRYDPIGQPEVLVTVGCAFVREAIAEESVSEENAEVQPLYDSPSIDHTQQQDNAHVDQYRALTMLYHEAQRDHENVDEEDERINKLFGQVDELLKGAEDGFTSSQVSECKTSSSTSEGLKGFEDPAMVGLFQEEDKLYQELHMDLEELVGGINRERDDDNLLPQEADALRNIFEIVLKTNSKAMFMLQGVDTRNLNLEILAQVVGASFTIRRRHVASLIWNQQENSHVPRKHSLSSSEEEEESSEDESSEDEAYTEVVELRPALDGLVCLSRLVISARSLSGDIEPFVRLGMEDLTLEYCPLSGNLAQSLVSAPSLHSLCLRGTNISGSLTNLTCPCLQVLDLRQTLVCGDISVFSTCEVLEELWLDNTSFSGDLAGLKDCRKLRILSAANTRLVLRPQSGALTSRFPVVSPLEFLDLTNVRLGETLEVLLDSLGSAFPVLEHLDLTHCDIFGDIGALVRCPVLKEVGLRYTSVHGDISHWLVHDRPIVLEHGDLRDTAAVDLVSNLAIRMNLSTTLLLNGEFAPYHMGSHISSPTPTNLT